MAAAPPTLAHGMQTQARPEDHWGASILFLGVFLPPYDSVPKFQGITISTRFMETCLKKTKQKPKTKNKNPTTTLPPKKPKTKFLWKIQNGEQSRSPSINHQFTFKWLLSLIILHKWVTPYLYNQVHHFTTYSISGQSFTLHQHKNRILQNIKILWFYFIFLHWSNNQVILFKRTGIYFLPCGELQFLLLFALLYKKSHFNA